MILALLGCVPKPVEPAAAPSRVGLVEVKGVAGKAPLRESLLRALATAAVTPCYEAALARDPGLYGEVVVRFTVDAGRVSEVGTLLTTLGDATAEACVVEAVRAVPFPGMGTPAITVVYPYLFTSDATPPVVARALKARYGLLPPDPTEIDPKKPAPEGTIYLW